MQNTSKPVAATSIKPLLLISLFARFIKVGTNITSVFSKLANTKRSIQHARPSTHYGALNPYFIYLLFNSLDD